MLVRVMCFRVGKTGAGCATRRSLPTVQTGTINVSSRTTLGQIHHFWANANADGTQAKVESRHAHLPMGCMQRRRIGFRARQKWQSTCSTAHLALGPPASPLSVQVEPVHPIGLAPFPPSPTPAPAPLALGPALVLCFHHCQVGGLPKCHLHLSPDLQPCKGVIGNGAREKGQGGAERGLERWDPELVQGAYGSLPGGPNRAASKQTGDRDQRPNGHESPSGVPFVTHSLLHAYRG